VIQAKLFPPIQAKPSEMTETEQPQSSSRRNFLRQSACAATGAEDIAIGKVVARHKIASERQSD